MKPLQSLSRTYRLTVVASLVVLGSSILCTVAHVPNGPILTALLFMMPVLWALWIASIVIERKNVLWGLALWVLIDLATLVLTSLLMTTSRSATGVGGEELAFFIAFSPLSWPMAVVAKYLPGDLIATIPRSFSAAIGVSDFMSEWLSFSLIAAIPSLIIAAFCRLRAGTHGVNERRTSL